MATGEHEHRLPFRISLRRSRIPASEVVMVEPAEYPEQDPGELTQPMRGQAAVAGLAPFVSAEGPRHGGATDPDRKPCDPCRGTGYQLTTNDLLREMLAVAGLRPVEDVKAADGFVVEFYRQFIESDEGKDWNDRLGPVFPADLTTAPYDDDASAGKLQREKLLAGLVRALADYDPDLWKRNPEARERYDDFLHAAGRSHVGFVRRSDGTVRGPATPAEYDEVEGILGAMVVAGLGTSWRAEYGPALAEAYRYAKIEMLWAQQHADQPVPPDPR